VRLHVRGFSAEKLLEPVYGQLFDHIDVFAAAVVASARIALGVFVGQLRALRPHHGGRGVVFAGDQLDVLFLAAVFGQDGGKDFGVGLFDEDVAVVHGSPRVKAASLHCAPKTVFCGAGKGCPGERLGTGTCPAVRFPVVYKEPSLPVSTSAAAASVPAAAPIASCVRRECSRAGRLRFFACPSESRRCAL
jgi:hypothetical protein